MPEARSAGRTLRFGVYESDLATGALRKNGSLIRLQEQPFQILAMLLERPGEMVTREDLRTKLWPADTFVDFDHSLNTAVNKLREALGDTASNPRFVQTVARRGYRFIAPVAVVESTGAERTPTQENALGDESSPLSTQPTAVHPELEVPLPKRGLTRGLFALIQLMYLIFYVVALARLGEVHRIADSFLPGWGAVALVLAVLVTAGVGIPLRCFLLSGVGFDHRALGEKFRRLF